MKQRALLLAASLALPLTLSGCLGKLLGGGKPAQTYRLVMPGLPAPASGATRPSIPSRRITLMPVRFAPEVEGDHILATRGRETMYIAGARWLQPAPTLFEEAVRDRFRDRSPPIVLSDRRDHVAADRILQITVNRFEAQFTGPTDQSAPLVVISGQAELFDAESRVQIGGLQFTSTQPASSSSITAIVAAFGKATSDVTGSIDGWPEIDAVFHRSTPPTR